MNRKNIFRSFLRVVIAASFLFALHIGEMALADSAQAAGAVQKLNKDNWAPDTREAINKVIAANASKKGAYAVFDWDNTCIYPDTQETLLIYMIDNLSFKMSPAEFQYAFTHYIDTGLTENLKVPTTDFASPYKNTAGKAINITSIAEDTVSDYTYFYNNYRAMNPNASGDMTLEDIQKTDQFKDFKAKVWFTYSALYDSFPTNVSYTWIIYIMFTGLTSAEVRDLAVKATDRALSLESVKVYFDSPESLPGKAGVISNTKAGSYIRGAMRLHPEIGNLYKALEVNKIPVYISTASLEDIIDAVATNPKYGYNLPQNRVMGLRMKKDANGKFIAQYDRGDNYTINSVGGKTVNLNNILVKKFNANPVMISGDSDGDYPMMTELSGLNDVKMVNDKKPVQLILIVNRLKGGNVGALCRFAAGGVFGKTVVVMQGRDENTGLFIPTEKTVKLGKAYSESNLKLLP